MVGLHRYQYHRWLSVTFFSISKLNQVSGLLLLTEIASVPKNMAPLQEMSHNFLDVLAHLKVG